MAAPTTYDRNSRIEVLLEALINAVEHSGSGTIARYGGRVDTYADLPAAAAPNTYYFVGPVDSDSFDEYMWAEVQGGTGHWDRLGSVTIIIDDHLDGASTNPVQNAVITNWLAPTYVHGTTYHKNDIVYHRYGLTDYGFFMAKVENPNSTPGVLSSDWELMSSITAIMTKNFNEDVGKKVGSPAGEIFNDYDNNSAAQMGHAEGSYAVAGGSPSHAEGFHTTASGTGSHAEGGYTVASHAYSHAEGNYTVASGAFSHAEGDHTTAAGSLSHAQGNYTIANGASQFVAGKFNIPDTTSAVIIGNGTADDARSNALTIDWSGNANASGSITATGAVISNQSNNAILRINNSQITGVSYVPTAGDGNPISSQAVRYALDPKADIADTAKVFKTADLYDSSSGTYAVKDTCVESGVLYVCKTAVTVAEAFDSSKWNAVTNTNGLFYIQPIVEAAHATLLTIDPNTFYIIV